MTPSFLTAHTQPGPRSAWKQFRAVGDTRVGPPRFTLAEEGRRHVRSS